MYRAKESCNVSDVLHVAQGSKKQCRFNQRTAITAWSHDECCYDLYFDGFSLQDSNAWVPLLG